MDETVPPTRGRRHRPQVHKPSVRAGLTERAAVRRSPHGPTTSPKTATRIERRRAMSRRRARLVGIVCLGFCALVLATSFPLSALFRQHQQISGATQELRTLTSGNLSLQKQATDLSRPANVAALARRDYDLVRPGQKAYTVLPLPGSTQSASSSGQSSLNQGPVAPGSAESQELLGGDGLSGSGTPGDSSTGAAGSGGSQPQSGRSAKGTPGLWTRVLGTLEFWH